MEYTNKVRNLNELLQKKFGDDVTLGETTITPLTSSGENYGSQMLAIEAKLKNKNFKENTTLNIVAKMCPPNEFLKETFNSSITFKKEIAAYNKIFPSLINFQKEQGVYNTINFFPCCYGARTNLSENFDSVDDDAILLLENLKLSGYDVVDRMQGFDLETTEFILKDLATFHATPIALKLLNPNEFNKKIRPYVKSYSVFQNVSEKSKESILNFIIKTAALDNECKEMIPRITKAIERGLTNIQRANVIREPFATIVHNDYWVNNTMLKFKNNRPVANKMLDFQLIEYGSPAKDFLFFLFSSVKMSVLELHYNKLLKLYYNNFISCLIDLNCVTAEFNFELFLNEINISAKSTELVHIIIMLRHILAVKDKVKELNEITEEDLVSEEQVSDACRERIIKTILYFAKNCWI